MNKFQFIIIGEKLGALRKTGGRFGGFSGEEKLGDASVVFQDSNIS